MSNFKPGLSGLQWHRLRNMIDAEIEEWWDRQWHEQLGDKDWFEGFKGGKLTALMKVRARLNTPEEFAQAEKTRREMFG